VSPTVAALIMQVNGANASPTNEPDRNKVKQTIPNLFLSRKEAISKTVPKGKRRRTRYQPVHLIVLHQETTKKERKKERKKGIIHTGFP
jgi:hypothetical protein